MKNTKFSKIALLVLSVAILVGCALAFSASAEEAPADNAILAQNLVYGDKVAVAYAINASIEDAAAGKVTVNYYWEGASDNVKKATYISDSTYKKNGVEYPVFITEGVAPKELAKVAYATTDGENYKTYSAAEYLYVRLYEDGFTFKTEEDGKDNNRKLLYQNLLAYGEQAQLVFDFNTDKLVTDYSIAYTTSELINFGGNSYVFGYGEITIDATVIGDGTIVGWNVTDGIAGGTTYATDEVVHSLTGTFNVEPIFGVHECVDVDPADHLCDSCGEVASTCVNANNTEDHKCDICGKVVDACVDESADGKCDVCNTYKFEVESMNSSSNISFVNIAANSGTDYTAASGTVGASSRPEGYSKGTWLYLTADPTNAANKVLASNSVSASSMTDDAISDIIFTPDVQVEGGDLVVLEYDYYVDGCTNNKNSMKFVYNYADSTTTRANATYATSAGVRLNADADGSQRWALDIWVKVRLVCDNTNKKIYTFVCTNGDSFVQCETVTDYSSATSTISSVGFTYIGYGVASTQYYDNIICVQTTAEAYGITLN